jgi:hypothetical protein
LGGFEQQVRAWTGGGGGAMDCAAAAGAAASRRSAQDAKVCPSNVCA